MENIVINVDFQSSDLSSIFANEVQVVPGDIAWEDLELMLKVYSDHECIKVSYADDDNDLVIIESQEELEEAFKVARKCNNTLKLMVICDGRPCPPDAFDLDRDITVYPPDTQFLDLFTGEHPPFLQEPPSPGDPEMLARGFGVGCEGRPSIPGAPSAKGGRDEMKAECGTGNVSSEREEQKVFFIANTRCENMVLDVEGQSRRPGASVIIYHRKKPCEGLLNQLWYADNRTSTIRTCLNDFCLDVIDGRLVISPCDLNKTSQKWAFSSSNRIQNIFSLNWVVGLKKQDVSDCDAVYGSAEEELVHVDWIKRSVDLEQCPELLGPPMRAPRWRLVPGPGFGYVVICDICDKTIQGIRYKCGFCPDFDLCAACEAKERVHDPTHILLKLNVPVEKAQLRYSTVESLLMRKSPGCGVASDGLYIPGCREALRQALVGVHEAGYPDEKTQWKEKCEGPLQATVLFDKFCQDGADSIRSGSKLVKRWVVQNTGASAWSSEVKVLPYKIDSSVSYTVTTEPVCLGGLPSEGVASIAVTAAVPQDKGTYVGVWRLSDGEEMFGEVLEFVFSVSPELTSAPTNHTDQIAVDGPSVDLDQEDDVLFQDIRRADLLTVEDLLTAELNPRELNGTSLTVPSNTPLADTPPRTPMVMEALEPDLASQNDGPVDAASASSSTADSPDFLNMAVMADLVHRKMSDLVTAGDYDYLDADGDDSDSSDNYSDDFFIVPVPDCFNPNLPPRKEASTTVVIKKPGGARGSCSFKSVDEMLRTSSVLASAPLLSPKCCFSTGSLDNEPSEQDNGQLDDAEASKEEEEREPSVLPTKVEAGSGSSNEEPAAESADGEDERRSETAPPNPQAADENRNVEVDVNQNETDRYSQEDNEQREAEQTREESAAEEPDEREERGEAEEGNFASGVEASTLKLMSTMFSFVAKTAKDVFYTLQDKNSYIPPRSDWTPSPNQWTPSSQTQWTPPSQNQWTPTPANTWTPPQQPTWSPSAHQWTPTTTPTSSPNSGDESSPMDQLIAMGFADRQLNQQLLLSSDNNVETVVQKLIEMSGNVR